MPVSADQILAYQKRIKELQKEANALTPQTRAEVERIVQDARHRIDDLIKSAAPTSDTLPARAVPRLAQEIQFETDRMIRDVTQTLQQAQTDAFNGGVQASRTIAQSIDLGAAFNAPTMALLPLAISHTADLVRSISTDLMPQVNGVLSRAALGSVNPYDAMKQVDALIGKGGTEGVSWQAERIVRSEVNRVYSIALDNSMQKLAAQFTGAKKVKHTWVSGPYRPGRRKNHQAIDGQTVPIDEPFVLEGIKGGTVKLMYPRDPSGPAEEVIACGCSQKIDETSLLDALNEVTV